MSSESTQKVEPVDSSKKKFLLQVIFGAPFAFALMVFALGVVSQQGTGLDESRGPYDDGTSLFNSVLWTEPRALLGWWIWLMKWLYLPAVLLAAWDCFKGKDSIDEEQKSDQ